MAGDQRAVANACHDDAGRVLSENGVWGASVIAVDINSILFINQFGHAQTGWLKRTPNSKVRVTLQSGFAAEPDDN